ncbi:hypothetical protein JT55_19455, partial [Rhodovulum sp. NI22]
RRGAGWPDHPRWLLPLVFLAVPGGAVWLGARMRPRGGVAFAAILAVLALAVLTGLGFDRYKERARRAVDFTPLPEVLAGVAPQPGTPVVAEFYTAGNLARLRPDWRIAPYLPFAMREFGGGPVLFVLRENTPETLEQGLREAGWDDPGDPQILDQGTFTLTFTTSGEAMKMRYYLVDTPGPGGDD